MTIRKPSMALAAAFALGLSFAPETASAACNWEWLCSGDGACRQAPVCDSLDEIPGPKPDQPAPKPPPMGMRPQQATAQKGGNVMCEQVMRQTAAGNWKWDQACYCSDDAKAHEASAPMSNMVRCAPGTMLSGAVAE